MSTPKLLAILVPATVAAAAMGSWIGYRVGTDVGDTTPQGSMQVDEPLVTRPGDELAARVEALSAELIELKEQVTALASQAEQDNVAAVGWPSAHSQADETDQNEIVRTELVDNSASDPQQMTNPHTADVDAGSGFGNFNRRMPTSERRREWLQSAGVYPEIADDINRRFDKIALKRLELEDLAAREGWLDSDRYQDESEALHDEQPQLRDEIGTEAYDRYLYAAGRSNRVRIVSVLTGSAADEMGLQQGDVLGQYDGERLLLMSDLTSLIRQGTRGEIVDISWYRDGQMYTSVVARGPLGVRLGTLRVDPDAG